MKNLAFTLFLLPFLMSCSSGGKNSEKNILLVEKYIRAVENLDYNTMTSLLDDNYQGLGPSYTDSINKEQAVAGWKDNVENLYESIKYTREQHGTVLIKEGYNKGEWVSSWAELNITYKNGEKVVIWANTAYKVEKGKIVKSFTFYNEADALRQLGYVFINPDNL
ncbi:MAG: hypothetical protein DRI73_09525 [Bacteroidetes bacterium]|nr:MAG: hypothetical protein DRI73_09525 [Bacteroidota bacterium]